MRFSELLNSYIEKSDMTKNSMINVLNIDRSTFFQILNGRRLPTNKQLMDIVENIDVSEAKVDTQNIKEMHGPALELREAVADWSGTRGVKLDGC